MLPSTGPTNNGEMIILTVPTLTEETRREYVKQAKSIAEEAKIALRNIRQDANKSLENLELPEDEEKRGNDRVQDLINEYNKNFCKQANNHFNYLFGFSWSWCLCNNGFTFGFTSRHGIALCCCNV